MGDSIHSTNTLAEYKEIDGYPTLGTRIMQTKTVHSQICKKPDGYNPSLRDIASLLRRFKYGWPLDHFVADLLLGRKEGTEFADISDERIQGLFYRRSGAIVAAIAITVEGPQN